MAACDPRRRDLRRMKTGALVLLGLTTSGFIVAHAMGNQGVWAWVRAFCEAATVGALADWFAVVALFRHPMGVPVPHAAIIPANKARIADNLAAFVRDHFLTPDILLAKLKVFDPAKRLGQWLQQPEQARMAADMARVWAVQGLNALDDRAIRGAIQSFVVSRLRQWDASATAGDVLGVLTRDGRHQALLDEALERLGNYLDDESIKRRASALMVKFARQEWPRIVGTVNLVKPIDDISDSLADRLARALVDELQAVLADPAHPLRADYAGWLERYVARLSNDPALIARVDNIKGRLIDHPELQRYVQALWDDVRDALRRDLEDPQSAIAIHLASGLNSLGNTLESDPALRDALNTHLLAGAASLTDRLRQGVTHHISQTVRAWDERQLVDELELSIGKDLQYIRYNGTLVGGIIGLVLHGVVLAMRV